MKLLVFCVFLAAGLASSEALLDWFRRTFGACRNDRIEKAPSRARDPVCEAKADNGECGFYDCFEERYPCGKCGFAKDHGLYNCERFTLPRFYNYFDFAGKQWINATGRCLTMKLKELYQRDHLSCKNAKDIMTGAISDCYVNNNFCNIMVDNARALFRVYEVEDIPKSLGNLREVLQIAGHCTRNAASRFIRRILELIADEIGPIHG